MALEDLNPNSPETRVPALPTPLSTQQFLAAVKETMEVREGRRGHLLDQNVTWRELVRSGVANIIINGQTLGGGDTTFPLQPTVGSTDLSPPPQPVGLSASSAIQTVILGWNDPGNPNISLTEVWRSSTAVAPGASGSVAVLIGTTAAYLYADDVGQSATLRYYWVRFRSKANIPGPFSTSVAASTGQVGGVDLSDLIVTAAKLAADAVEEGKIKDAAVTTTKIANLAVGNAAIQNGAITNAKIGNLAVDSAKIADAAIVEAKIADASITNAKIAAATITDAKIATATITGARIASATITGANIASATIGAANIVGATITSAQIAAATITGANIASATIGGANIASATITGANIASATIGSANIAAATITGANIANATITDANIGSLNAGKITAGTLDAARIAAGTITGTMIAGNSIVAGNIATGTITADRIQAGTITADRLQAGTITAASGVIGTLAITSANIQDSAIGSAKIAASIQSDNYSGTAGWIIQRSGVAIFNEVSVRGQINTGSYTSYAWPASGGGVHLSSSGLLMGNYTGGGRFLQWDEATGQMFVGSGGAAKLTLTSSGELNIEGKVSVPCPGGNVQLGRDVGPSGGHYGLSLSHTDFNNIFIRRSDGVTFFRVGSGTNNYMSYDSVSQSLTIKGTLTADAINAVNTLNISGNAVTTVKSTPSSHSAMSATGSRFLQSFSPWLDFSTSVTPQKVVLMAYVYASPGGGSTEVGLDFQITYNGGTTITSIAQYTDSHIGGFGYGHTLIFDFAPLAASFSVRFGLCNPYSSGVYSVPNSVFVSMVTLR